LKRKKEKKGLSKRRGTILREAQKKREAEIKHHVIGGAFTLQIRKKEGKATLFRRGKHKEGGRSILYRIIEEKRERAARSTTHQGREGGISKKAHHTHGGQKKKVRFNKGGEGINKNFKKRKDLRLEEKTKEPYEIRARGGI